MTFGTEKNRMAWLPDGENFLKMFIRFERIHERDRQTDTQTDTQTPHDGIGRACIASHGKKSSSKNDRIVVQFYHTNCK